MSDSGSFEKRERQVLDELNYTASRISELARLVGLGLAGLFLFFATSSSEFAQDTMRSYPRWVLTLSAIGCLILALEYAQNLLAYLIADHAFDTLNQPRKSPWRNSYAADAQRYAFWAKQLVTIVGVLGLATLIIMVAESKTTRKDAGQFAPVLKQSSPVPTQTPAMGPAQGQ
jgi:hypothetical protein